MEIQQKKLECELRIPGNFFRRKDINRDTKLRKREELFPLINRSKMVDPFSIPNPTFSLCLWDTSINPRNVLQPKGKTEEFPEISSKLNLADVFSSALDDRKLKAKNPKLKRNLLKSIFFIFSHEDSFPFQ